MFVVQTQCLTRVSEIPDTFQSFCASLSADPRHEKPSALSHSDTCSEQRRPRHPGPPGRNESPGMLSFILSAHI